MNRIMVDIETMGLPPKGVIISIGAVRFDGRGILDRFETGVDPESCVDVGMVMTVSTVMWWLAQSEEARKDIVTKQKNGYTISEALLQFSNWCTKEGKVTEVWGNGSDFDNVILVSAFQMCGIEVPWMFWTHRCFRTMKNQFSTVQKPPVMGIKHSALADAEHQANWLRKIEKSL